MYSQLYVGVLWSGSPSSFYILLLKHYTVLEAFSFFSSHLLGRPLSPSISLSTVSSYTCTCIIRAVEAVVHVFPVEGSRVVWHWTALCIYSGFSLLCARTYYYCKHPTSGAVCCDYSCQSSTLLCTRACMYLLLCAFR